MKEKKRTEPELIIECEPDEKAIISTILYILGYDDGYIPPKNEQPITKSEKKKGSRKSRP